MRQRLVGGSKAVAAGGVVLAVLGALTACGASGPSAPGSATTATASSTAAASASVGALSALRSVPDTAANRGSIVVNNVSAIWSAAGLPATPSGAEAASRTGQNATTQVYEGSPAGTILWRLAPNDPAPLGYPALSVRQEIMIGPIVDQVSEVWAPVSATAVAAAVHPLRPGTGQAGAGVLYDLGPHVTNRPAPFNQLLLGTRYLLVPSSGGRIITGSISMPQSTLTALATGARVAHSLAADPAVSAVIGALGPKFQTLTMGTYSPTPSEIFAHATPAMLELLNRMTGLGRLRRGPLMTGFAYTGGPLTAQTVVAAALYPSAADARSAADITARYATDGTSLRFGRPYSTLWRVNKTSVRGSLVVMNLTTMFPGSVTQAYMSNDFPLFWSPA